MTKMSRREMLKITTGAIAGVTAMGLPGMASAQNTAQDANKKLKILVIGAHPDDPETGCGGTMARLVKAGHEVVSVYLTRGEAGIEGKTHDETAKIRTEEIYKACKIMNTRPVFLSQIDGSTEINAARYKEMMDVVKKENPDIVFTHWPVDSHRDHRICSVLVYDAWRHMNHSFELYYFEVMAGVQTQNFNPNGFVDITDVIDIKKEACYCHGSQEMDELYKGWHRPMEIFRGLQSGHKFAEGFIAQDQSKRILGSQFGL
jgi:LmbE family N-acetylglucosaminyl deacetylase